MSLYKLKACFFWKCCAASPSPNSIANGVAGVSVQITKLLGVISHSNQIRYLLHPDHRDRDGSGATADTQGSSSLMGKTHCHLPPKASETETQPTSLMDKGNRESLGMRPDARDVRKAEILTYHPGF